MAGYSKAAPREAVAISVGPVINFGSACERRSAGKWRHLAGSTVLISLDSYVLLLQVKPCRVRRRHPLAFGLSFP
jgi:hypothetical protein